MFGVFLAIAAIAAITLASRVRRRNAARATFTPARRGNSRPFLSSDFAAAAESTASDTTRENTAAAYALGKTVAFLLYAPLGAFAVPLLEFLPHLERLSQGARNIVGWGVLVGVESLLLGLVIRGRLPGTRRARAEAFSERQLAIGTTILSVLAWIIFGHTFVGGVVRIIISVAVILSSVVYFIAKSIVSQSLRAGVLSVAILPVFEMAYEFRALPPPILRMCRAVVGP